MEKDLTEDRLRWEPVAEASDGAPRERVGREYVRLVLEFQTDSATPLPATERVIAF